MVGLETSRDFMVVMEVHDKNKQKEAEQWLLCHLMNIDYPAMNMSTVSALKTFRVVFDVKISDNNLFRALVHLEITNPRSFMTPDGMVIRCDKGVREVSLPKCLFMTESAVPAFISRIGVSSITQMTSEQFWDEIVADRNESALMWMCIEGNLISTKEMSCFFIGWKRNK
jgi:hypothetical protein